MSVIVLVIDSVGIGALPDAAFYGDEGSNTLVNVSKAADGLALPTLEYLGLGKIVSVKGVADVSEPAAAYGRMAEAGPGKDTTTGHWELMGLVLDIPFPVYPHGFPRSIISAFEARIGRRTLGNKPASGTAIIAELGAQHLVTGYPIIYTSGDSVFQIAAHEEVISLEELYDMCTEARTLLTGPHAVGRVIARPFVGKPGSFRRTANRRDFSLPPPAPTILDVALKSGKSVLGIGKIGDIFAGRGLSDVWHSSNNQEGMALTNEAVMSAKWDLVFTNLVDFDMLYGHRNDPLGYAQALEQFDRDLSRLLPNLKPEDVLIITADHGCDPTTPSTDHSREYVPLLVYGHRITPQRLGTRRTFADVGATVAEMLDLPWKGPGTGFSASLSNSKGGCTHCEKSRER
ncbi:MAG TPA: phosphopentomutase [Firmicutes bacterium]|jgi:phosphopentomutase|nr:phosphopentomutase [Bacillota bacterium]